MEKFLIKINNAALLFLSTLSLNETYNIIVREAVKLIKGRYGSIWIKQNGQLERAYVSYRPVYLAKVRKDGNTYKSFRSKKIILANIASMKNPPPELLKHKIKSSLFIPLLFQNRAIGVLIVSLGRQVKLEKKTRNALKLFGTLAGVAIRQAQSYSEANEALRTRDSFISMATHELRTPLTSMYGYIQLLNKKAGDSPSPEARWLRELFVESMKMNNLLNEFVNISQLKAGKLDFDFNVCHLRNIIDSAIRAISQTYPDRRVTMVDRLGQKDGVIADQDKLKDVLISLLDNAIKFSPEEAEVKVLATISKSLMSVKIVDRGIGISKQDLPTIFAGYKRAGNNSKEGIGFGLFLSDRIVRKHKGKIVIETEVDKGTSVEVDLPVIQE